MYTEFTATPWVLRVIKASSGYTLILKDNKGNIIEDHGITVVNGTILTPKYFEGVSIRIIFIDETQGWFKNHTRESVLPSKSSTRSWTKEGKRSKGFVSSKPKVIPSEFLVSLVKNI